MNRFLCAEGNSPTTIVIYIVLVIALVFILVAPYFTQRKRNKQMQNMLGGLKAGDLVETASGVIGRVMKIIDKGEIKTVILETGSKTEKSYIEVDLRVISMILKSSKAEAQPEEKEEVSEEKVEEVKSQTEEVKEVSAETTETSEKKEEKPKKKRTTSAIKKK